MAQELAKAKKKQSKLIRNVLVQPFKQYWPVINEEDVEELAPTVKCTLSPMKMDVSRPPWSVLRKLNKEERKEKMAEYTKALPEEIIESHKKALKFRQNIFVGINAVLRGGENKLVDFALVAEEVNPKILVQPLIQLLYSFKIPVLVVPNLKEITKDALGFTCIALGFKKCEHNSEVKKIVLKLFNNLKPREVEEELESSSDTEVQFEPVAKVRKIADEENDLDSIYIYTNDEGYERKRFRQNPDSDSEVTAGNIKLTQNPNENEPNTFSKDARYYLPPTVNRLQSNPFKKRKKK